MPFCLANTIITFESYINQWLIEKLDVFCIVYLDNILIYISKKSAKHKEVVKWVLEKLLKYGLYSNPKNDILVLMWYTFGGILYHLQG